MLDIEAAVTNSRILRSLTGLNAEEFATLSVTFAAEYKRLRAAARRRRNPQRRVGGGRPAQLSTTDQKLFFILFYLRIYPTMEVSGFLFGVVKSVVFDWTKELLPVLEAALKKRCELPVRKIRTVEEFLEEYPEAKRVIIDSTERPRTRPKDKVKQKSHYSGKKKRHTYKNTVVVNSASKRVLLVAPTVPGPRSDVRDAEPIVSVIPEEVPIDGDLGYKGLEKKYESIHLPHKKPKNGELTDEQKAFNTVHARRRVAVEHSIGGIKRNRCLSDVYRNRRENLEDDMMIVSAGLHNHRLTCRAYA
jgi:hypothetical protein